MAHRDAITEREPTDAELRQYYDAVKNLPPLNAVHIARFAAPLTQMPFDQFLAKFRHDQEVRKVVKLDKAERVKFAEKQASRAVT